MSGDDDAASSAICEVSGDNLRPLLQEAGGITIQRVPPTERKGRVHTSTLRVAVVEITETKRTLISKSDLEVDWFSGTGAGGQHRNKHQNSCRLTHKPTGIQTSAQCRSRENSYAQALDELQRRVDSVATKQVADAKSHARLSSMGSGQRSDTSRVYRFQDNVAHDKTTGVKCSLTQVLRGRFDLLWETQ